MIDYGTIFLLWSYFGISVEEMKKSDDNGCGKVIDAAVLRAYRDASSHVLSVKEIHKEKLKKKAVKYIKEFIIELENVSSSETRLTQEQKCKKYDGLHKDTCKNLVKLYNNESYYVVDKKGKKHKFTYGIAQKWVNMSMKYIYLIEGLLDDTFEMEWVHYFASDFHVPLDSYIFKAMKDELQIDADSYLKVKNWSNIEDYDNYKELQKRIRTKLSELSGADSITPIEWENTAWIRVCSKR